MRAVEAAPGSAVLLLSGREHRPGLHETALTRMPTAATES